jgi:hypothetical protein
MGSFNWLNAAKASGVACPGKYFGSFLFRAVPVYNVIWFFRAEKMKNGMNLCKKGQAATA